MHDRWRKRSPHVKTNTVFYSNLNQRAMNTFVVQSNFRQIATEDCVVYRRKALLNFELYFICMNQCKFHIWIWTVAYLWALHFIFFQSRSTFIGHMLFPFPYCEMCPRRALHISMCSNEWEKWENGKKNSKTFTSCTYSANYIHVAVFYESTTHSHTYLENLQMHLSHCQFAAFQIASIFSKMLVSMYCISRLLRAHTHTLHTKSSP